LRKWVLINIIVVNVRVEIECSLVHHYNWFCCFCSVLLLLWLIIIIIIKSDCLRWYLWSKTKNIRKKARPKGSYSVGRENSLHGLFQDTGSPGNWFPSQIRLSSRRMISKITGHCFVTTMKSSFSCFNKTWKEKNDDSYVMISCF
jgi:hypothetical protein